MEKNIEFKERGREREEGRTEQDREKEETSFTERTEETEDDYDDIRSRINSEEAPTQSETNVGFDDEADSELAGQIHERAINNAVKRYNAIQALESLTDTRFSITHGESSKGLIDFISGDEYSEKGNLIALKFKGEDVKLTAKGKLDGRSAKTANKNIVKAIEDAKVEYEKSFDAVADEGAGLSLSDEARESVRESVAGSLEDLVWDRYGEISQSDSDKNIEREIKGIPYVDKNIDYDNLEDQSEKNQYDAKIAGLKVDTEHWKNLEEKEQDPTKKLLYKTAKELCIVKKSYMEVRANQRPESKEVQEMIREGALTNNLTRFERFKRWAKENLVGVSAVAISVAGVITTAVVAGRNAVKKGAKAVGQFGKALANLAKKAGPAIATILNILAQVLTWGAKALEFLSRNLWIVALFLTYLVYDTVKERMKNKKTKLNICI